MDMSAMFYKVPCESAYFSVTGTRPSDRYRTVHTNGITLAVYERRNAEAMPLILVHGELDIVSTVDVFTPRLADGGYRVVAHDERGHDDCEHIALYRWLADEWDIGEQSCATHSIYFSKLFQIRPKERFTTWLT